MTRTKIGIGIAASCAAAWALVTAYHIEPKTAAMSGWTRRAAPNNYVSEVITCNFDSLSYVELFVGDTGCSGTLPLFPAGSIAVAARRSVQCRHGWNQPGRYTVPFSGTVRDSPSARGRART